MDRLKRAPADQTQSLRNNFTRCICVRDNRDLLTLDSAERRAGLCECLGGRLPEIRVFLNQPLRIGKTARIADSSAFGDYLVGFRVRLRLNDLRSFLYTGVSNSDSRDRQRLP